MRSGDLEAIHERLGRLERENHRLRAGLLVVLAVVASAVLVQCSGAKSDTVKARQFLVEDAEGRVRASLAAEEEGTRLRFFDEEGVRRASFALTPDGSPGLALFHDAQHPGVIVEVGKKGAVLMLNDAKGNPLFRKP